MLFGDTSGFLCVYVGRLSKEKQIDVLISAIQDIPDTYLAIVGTERVILKLFIPSNTNVCII
jgi:glycosyltransferase involved in cell wall biosynthesis